MSHYIAAKMLKHWEIAGIRPFLRQCAVGTGAQARLTASSTSSVGLGHGLDASLLGIRSFITGFEAGLYELGRFCFIDGVGKEHDGKRCWFRAGEFRICLFLLCFCLVGFCLITTPPLRTFDLGTCFIFIFILPFASLPPLLFFSFFFSLSLLSVGRA